MGLNDFLVAYSVNCDILAQTVYTLQNYGWLKIAGLTHRRSSTRIESDGERERVNKKAVTAAGAAVGGLTTYPSFRVMLHTHLQEEVDQHTHNAIIARQISCKKHCEHKTP